MTISKLFKQYFFGDSKTLIINFVILIFCTIFVIINNYSFINKTQSHTQIIISDFPPTLIDSFNSSIYDLGIKTYRGSSRDKVELREITLSWKRNDKDTDLQKVELLKDRIIEITNRYLIFANDHINKINQDYDSCLLYMHNDLGRLPDLKIDIESKIKYISWYQDNLEKLITIKRDEIKFTNKNNIIDVIFSSLFLSILFIILINFVRHQKKNL
jgi:hypothetical protein